MVGGVCAHGDRETHALEVLRRARHAPVVHHAAGLRREEDELVEEPRHLDAGLVDHHDDGNAPLLGHDLEDLDAELRVRGRQPRRGLVAKHQMGAADQTAGQAHPPTLAARDAAHVLAADLRVLHVQQAQVAQQAVEVCGDLPLRHLGRHGLLEHTVERHRLADGPMRRHDVCLPDVRDHPGEEGRPFSPVEAHLTAVLRRLLPRQNVHQRRLPAARRPHEGHQLARADVSAALFQNGLLHRPLAVLRVGLLHGKAHVLPCQ
mmetsp:Transcript_2777/g.8353  ORF Transcript_2777/g.8353 Transcript_2777/m.8353 type:complete len:262 (+) Transcript_2777:1142-1927(+)